MSPDEMKRNIQTVIEYLSLDVASDCRWCNGEGSWTRDDDNPRMIPVQHKYNCPIEILHRIDESIDAAVAAEHKRTLEQAAQKADGIWHLKDFEGNDIDHVVTDPIAAAIRALP